ncbi:hypothetical protein BGZ83_006671 [Gryganskiella cystojenkinii]|nr:hypothetical protein BGZ83_006671 [Gryganskiella cystojenkinii]
MAIDFANLPSFLSSTATNISNSGVSSLLLKDTPHSLIVAKTATVASIGLFAGIALSFNAVFMPSLRRAPSTDQSLPVWADSYNISKNIQVGLILTSLVSGSAVYARTENPYFLIGPLIMTSIIPYTLWFIMPVNKVLLGILNGGAGASKSKRGLAVTDSVEELLVKWDLLHFGRTVLSTAALCITLYGSFNQSPF